MVEFLTDFAQGASALYLLCSFLLSTVFALLFIPSLPITTVNVIVYGPVFGGVLSFLAEIFSAYLTFYLYRWGWLRAIEKIPKVNDRFANRMENPTRRGFWKIVFLRLIPFFPSIGVTVYALVRKIGLLPYMWGSIIGKIPAMVVEVLGSLGITWLFVEWLDNLLIALFIVVLGFYLLKRMFTNHRASNHE